MDAAAGRSGPATGRPRPAGRAGAPWSSSFPALVALAGAVTGAVALVMVLGAGWSSAHLVGDLSMTAAAGVATAACRQAAGRGGDTARAWRFLAVAAGILAASALVRTGYGVVDGATPPFPSVADAGWLVAVVPAMAGLLLFPRRGERLVSRLRAVLDGLVIAVGLLFVGWATVFGPVYEAASVGVVRLAGLLHLVVDLVVASVVIALGVRARAETRRMGFLLYVGLLTLALADSVSVLRAVNGMTGPTRPVLVIGSVAAFLLVALAARAPVLEPDGSRNPSFTVVQELLPYGPVLAAAAVAVAGQYRIDSDQPFLLVSGSVLFVLIALHQVVIAAEKVGLADGLERTVAVRTAALTDLARRSELILDSAGDGIYGVDADGCISFVNPAAGDMLGYDVAEMVGTNSHDLFHTAAGHPKERCPVTVALRTGARQHSAADSFRRKDGTLFGVEKVASPIQEAGRVTGAVVTFRDISERLEVDRMKSEFTSVVSHELRTPLTSIRGSLGLLASGAVGTVPEKGKRMLDIAVSNTDRLVRLINDILDIERIESGTIAMERQRVGAAALIGQARDAMDAMAHGAGVDIVVRPVDADLWADPDRLMQTLTNLLSNAIKFSPRGGVVRLGAERRGEDVLFSVKDEGRGIPPGSLEAIFERFQQVDSSDAREKGGSGLGLPICRSIVEQHGGRIWVESTVGLGSEFFVALPASAAAGGPDAGPANGPVVLVCDDDPGALEVISSALAQHGYRAITATSGEHALELAAREQPVAILLDLLMPGLSGWETATRLKAQPETRTIPIVICSLLRASDSDVPVITESAGWLHKPFDETSLVEALEAALLTSTGPSSVLVVEDDPDLARVLTAMFQRHNTQTYHAATGSEALRLSERVRPDLIVLDLMLPDTDGFAVVDGLRRDERLLAVPLVVYTARDLDESQRTRLTLGQTHFFTKGRVSPEDFEHRVTRLLASLA